MGSCLTFRSKLSEETHGLTKQETLLGRGRPGGGGKQQIKEPRRTALLRGSKAQGLW